MNELNELIRNLEVFNRPEDIQAIVDYAKRREIEFEFELSDALAKEYESGYDKGIEDGIEITASDYAALKKIHQEELDEAFDKGRKDAINNPHLCEKLKE